MSAMRIVITGGAGFIGSALCLRLLDEGHEVIVVDNFYTGRRENLPKGVELIEHDICVPLEIGGAIDRIYNLACPASPPAYQKDPIFTLRTNVVGTLNVLELARATGARFLQASTSEIYGDPEVHPQPESYRGAVNTLGPRACYDEGKRAAEAACMDYERVHGIEVRIARIFNTYGPRMDPEDGRVVSNFIMQALRGEPLTLYGDGRQTRSFCFVSDLVDGLVRLMEHRENPGPVNLGNPDERSVADLARIVLELTGKQSELVHRPLPADDPKVRCPDLERARSVLGYAPSVPLEEGLKTAIEWFATQV